jgi:Ca2+-binding RTX toxin-like protein
MKRRSVAVTAVCAALISQAVVMAPANGAPACFGRRPTIVGTEENNRLRGTPGPDVIVGLGGRDRIDGRGGNDRICGNAKRDTLRGGPGRDRLSGAKGPDDLWGDAGNDLLIAGQGPFHSFYPGGGNDVLRGARNIFDDVDYFNSPRAVNVNLATGRATGYGTDTLHRIDDIYGSRFDDSLRGSVVSNYLYGWRGNDTIAALGSRPGIFNADFLEGGPGNDALDGGQAYDVADHSSGKKGVDVDLAAGTASGQGHDTLEGIEGVDGTRAADTLTGDDGNNAFEAYGGNDSVSGAGGRDIVEYFSARRGVTVNLNLGTSTGTGSDTLNTVEDVYGSYHNDALRGDGGPNRIWALPGNDAIFGLAGADILQGNFGNDRVDGGADNDACAAEIKSNCETTPSLSARFQSGKRVEIGQLSTYVTLRTRRLRELFP